MINIIKRFALLCLAVMVCVPAGAEEHGFSKYVLDNGLTVLINEMPSSPMVAVYGWVKTGSTNEGKLLGSGVTHFVEHMLFKGTASRAAGVISDEVRALGGSINAATSHDYTVFTLSLPREKFSGGLDIIADMLRNASFKPEEVERERDVILKEMRMINDRPERKLDDAVYQALYLSHPYRYPIIGYEQMFKAITREQLFDYYKLYYAPNNIILSIAGGVKAAEILPVIKKAFDGFMAQPTPLRVLPQEAFQVTSRSVAVEYPTDLIRMVIAYQGMPLLDKDLFAGDVLAIALGSGQSSRFNQELYEKQRLVESVEVGNNTPLDRGYFEIACLLKKEGVDKVLAETQRMIDDVKAHGLKPEEIAKARRVVMAQNIYERQTAEGVAHRAAMEEAFAGDAQFSEKYLEGVRAVTNEDIKRVASRYLVESSRTVVVMRPKSSEGVVLVGPAEPKVMDAQLITLSNGIKVILKRDPLLPLVSVRAVIKGGLREEPKDKPGLAELTGRVWSRGVKGKNVELLFREMEDRAGSLSVGTGLDQFVVSLDVLSEDAGLAFEDLSLLLRSPAFPEVEIRKEKEDMLTALQARKDSIAQTSFRALDELLFTEHPMRLDPLGTPASLAGITRQDIVSYYGRFVSPQNIIIAVYGDIDETQVKAKLEMTLGSMKPFEVKTTIVNEEPLSTSRLKELSMNKEQAFVVYGFHAPKIGTPEKYALEIAVNALSSSLGGRMFKRIRDELGKAYALSGFYSPGMDMGMCAFYVLTTKENVEKVRSLIEEELKNAAEKGFSDKEINDAKSYVKSDFARETQAIGAQASRDINSEFYGLGYMAFEKYNERIDAVTADAARKVVADYLNISKAAVVVTRPVK
ncbi:MAG: insulinase family protein [Candidatus Omnitrophica bacterium]|nr:insulinase family protein [Candidatus Omnitrophota bacterium]